MPTGRFHSDFVGKRFANLVVIRFDGISKHGHARWWCQCDCGREKSILSNGLTSGVTKGCGCLNRRLSCRSFVSDGHRGSKTAEYACWEGILNRCLDPGSTNYPRYGGKGIEVCERWKSFENFLADMGPKPSPSHSIDRFPDRNGNYEPGNCRWATRIEQGRNTSRNRRLVFRGEEKTLAEWAEITGIKRATIGARIDSYGWSVEKALSVGANNLLEAIK